MSQAKRTNNLIIVNTDVLESVAEESAKRKGNAIRLSSAGMARSRMSVDTSPGSSGSMIRPKRNTARAAASSVTTNGIKKGRLRMDTFSIASRLYPKGISRQTQRPYIRVQTATCQERSLAIM